MAWTQPKTWVTAEMVNAAMLNTYVRDNLSAIRDQVACKIRRAGTSAAQSIPNTTETRPSFDTVDFDTTGTMADLGANRIIFPISGKYVIGAGSRWISNSVGHREMKTVYFDVVAGLAQRIDHDSSEAASGVAPVLSSDTVYDCKAGDYCYITVWQNSGAALNMLTLDICDPTLYVVKEGI